VATVAVVGVVAVGGLLMINRPSDSAVGAASPTPAAAAVTASPLASAGAGAPIPAELQYRWIGQPRDVGRGLSSRTGLNFSSDAYYLSGTNYVATGLVGSLASVSDVGEITLVTPPDASDDLCAEGDVGVYGYELSPGGTMLHMTASSEACEARSTAVSGDWYRVACKSEENACWGELEAGTYLSQYLDPRLDPDATWEVPFGALAFTVPDGWSNASDWPTRFHLTPTTDYANWTADGPPPESWHGVFVYGRPAASGQLANCANNLQDAVARTPEALVGWISSRPGIVAGEPQAVTIDGYTGLSVDVRVASDWTTTCEGETTPVVMLMAEATGGDPGWSWGILSGEHQRLIFLDLGDGDTVLIGIESVYPDRWDALLAEAMPIVESFDFK
jgi:hypothetical protein